MDFESNKVACLCKIFHPRKNYLDINVYFCLLVNIGMSLGPLMCLPVQFVGRAINLSRTNKPIVLITPDFEATRL